MIDSQQGKREQLIALFFRHKRSAYDQIDSVWRSNIRV